MPRAPNEKIKKAFELYKKGLKLKEIADKLDLPDGTIRRWKSTHNWDSERSDKNMQKQTFAIKKVGKLVIKTQ